MEPNVKHVLAVYALASEDQLAAGLAWYREANDLARELDPSNPNRAAGVIAAVSPLTPWQRNKDLARQAYAEGSLTYGTLTRNAAKANRILAGEDPLAVLSGDKVRAFYAAIADPDESDNVVIDRHAFSVAVGARVTDDGLVGRTLKRKGVYAAFASAYVAAAKTLGVSAVAVQAVTWTVWRELHLTGTKYEWILANAEGK